MKRNQLNYNPRFKRDYLVKPKFIGVYHKSRAEKVAEKMINSEYLKELAVKHEARDIKLFADNLESYFGVWKKKATPVRWSIYGEFSKDEIIIVEPSEFLAEDFFAVQYKSLSSFWGQNDVFNCDSLSLDELYALSKTLNSEYFLQIAYSAYKDKERTMRELETIAEKHRKKLLLHQEIKQDYDAMASWLG